MMSNFAGALWNFNLKKLVDWDTDFVWIMIEHQWLMSVIIISLKQRLSLGGVL